MKLSSNLQKLLTGLALISLPLAAANADEPKSAPESHEAHTGHMLEAYIAITQALFADDLDAAKKAASEMAEHDKDSELAKGAAKIAAAQDLPAARAAFKDLSAVAIKVAKTSKPELHVMHCPMVKGGGGDWLSADAKVNNPYFGAQMPHCGSLKK